LLPTLIEKITVRGLELQPSIPMGVFDAQHTQISGATLDGFHIQKGEAVFQNP